MNENKNIENLLNTALGKFLKPLDYLLILMSILSIIGLIIVKEWRLIGLCFIFIFIIRWVVSLIYTLLFLLNTLVEKVSYKNRIIGNILGYLLIIVFNLIIIAVFYFASFICIVGHYEGNGGLDLLPYLTSSWVLTFIPLRFMSQAIKKDNEEFSNIYVIYAIVFFLSLPTSFLGLVISTIATVILIIITFVLIPVYQFKKSSNPLE